MAAKKIPKFTRASNFSTYEEEVLIALVKKYKDVIECKSTDACTPRERNAAWEQLAKDFNCNSGQQFRSLEVIKRKYENLKKRTKQKYADEKIKIRCTGGGPYEEVNTTLMDSDIKEILGASLTGFSSQFDDDNELDMTENFEDPQVDNIVETETNNSNNIQILRVETLQPSSSKNENTILGSTTEKNGDWSHYTPKMLKTKKSSILQHSKTPYNQAKGYKQDKTGKALENKLVAWSNGKLELVEFQKQMFLEEQTLKLEHLKEKHEKSIEREERESQERIKAIQEEHRIKMEILELQKAKYM